MTKKEIGNIGEEVACKFLKKEGFLVLGQNYSKKWGEIDIIAKKEGKIHFVEVKTVSRETLHGVTRETGSRPEENVHPWKLKRLSRVIQSYLLEKSYMLDDSESGWQFDVLAVFLDLEHKEAKVRVTENVIL